MQTWGPYWESKIYQPKVCTLDFKYSAIFHSFKAKPIMSCFQFSRVLPQLHVLICDWLESTFWYNWLVCSLLNVSNQSKSLLGESDRAHKHETCLNTKYKNKNLLDKVNTCTTAKHLIYEGRNIQFHLYLSLDFQKYACARKDWLARLCQMIIQFTDAWRFRTAHVNTKRNTITLIDTPGTTAYRFKRHIYILSAEILNIAAIFLVEKKNS